MNPILKCALALMTVLVTALITSQSAQAQTYTTLYSFCSASKCKDGSQPAAGLLQATDGNLYGTTWFGGGIGDCQGYDGCGTVFKISLSGTLTILHRFNGTTEGGGESVSGLAQATNGDFYGTTSTGGDGLGTAFRVTPAGQFKTLHTFGSTNTDGNLPYAALTLGTDGDLFGTTYVGGIYDDGTIFKITPSGTLTTLYTVDLTYWNPFAGLVQATNGDFYGTSQWGGSGDCYYGCGTIFKITADGTLTTIYSFAGVGNDLAGVDAPLVQATDGDLYGTTSGGGSNSSGSVFRISPSGSGFKTLYSFPSNTYIPTGLIQATDGNLYGTTVNGGANGAGTIFKITPSGTLTTLYSFCPQGPPPNYCPDGGDPYAGLIQDTNGNLYGTTQYGGANGYGVVFSLSVGLGPFVATQINSGKVGAAVTILGTDLTGATSVTFNGTAATFTVVSASEITATVPTGATTGFIVVKTPGGTLTSNKKFTVKT